MQFARGFTEFHDTTESEFAHNVKQTELNSAFLQKPYQVPFSLIPGPSDPQPATLEALLPTSLISSSSAGKAAG